MASIVDLHLHTQASDGRLSPTELVNLLAARGVKVAAISDHDTTEGLAEAYQAVAAHPDLQLIPAIELSADSDDPAEEIHILGYYLQYGDEEFQDILRHFRRGRLERGRAMVERLAELGLPVAWERVQEIAGDGAVGRPHIALALVEQGYFQEPKEAFAEYLGNGGLAYVDRRKMSAEQAVQMLAKVGAPAVLGPSLHPGRPGTFGSPHCRAESRGPGRNGSALRRISAGTGSPLAGNCPAAGFDPLRRAAITTPWAIAANVCPAPMGRRWNRWSGWRNWPPNWRRPRPVSGGAAMFPELAILYLYSYFIGAAPTAYLLARLVKGIDLRQYGSGNLGGSNLLRQAGKKGLIPALVFDFCFKGVSPTILALSLLPPGTPWPLLLAAPLLALAGNNWSVFLRGQGGRGILVVCGMLFSLVPILFALALLLYLAGWRLTRSSGVWVLIALAALPLLALLPLPMLTAGWPALFGALSGTAAAGQLELSAAQPFCGKLV